MDIEKKLTAEAIDLSDIEILEEAFAPGCDAGVADELA